MENVQMFFIFVGAITLMWLVYKIIKCIIKGLPVLLGDLQEAGFRSRFPFDFKMSLGWIVSEMKSRGYEEIDMMDPGSENPGVLMKNPETEIEMGIRLRAPLFSDKGYSIVVSKHGNNTAIVMQNSASDENKKY